jgi:hypothetical protein
MQLQLIHHDQAEERRQKLRVVTATAPRPERPVLDRRHAQRVPLQAHVLYTSGGAEALPCDGEGRVRNLSKKGCQIVGNTPLVQGSLVTLSLDLGDGQPPLCLPGALVCWTDGACFSVKFPPMTDEARYRLQQLVLKFAARRDVSRTHTAFRVM